MTIEAILFDLGDVACRFRPERRLAALTAASALPAAAIRAIVWESGFDADCDRGRYSAAEIHAHLRARIGLRLDYPAFCDAWALAWEPDAAVLRLVDELAPGVRAALLSDNGPVLLEALPTGFPEVMRRFDPLLFSCHLDRLKAAPGVFARALAALGLPADRVLHVDDSPRNVAAARAAGLHGLHFTWANQLRRDLAELGLLRQG